MPILEIHGNDFFILFPIYRIYIIKGIEGIYFYEDNPYIREATWIRMCKLCIGRKPFQFVLTLVLALCSLTYYILPSHLLFHMSWIERCVHEQFMNRQIEPLQALRAQFHYIIVFASTENNIQGEESLLLHKQYNMSFMVHFTQRGISPSYYCDQSQSLFLWGTHLLL